MAIPYHDGTILVRWIDNPRPVRRGNLVFLVNVPGHDPGWFCVKEVADKLDEDGARQYAIRDINLDLQP